MRTADIAVLVLGIGLASFGLHSITKNEEPAKKDQIEKSYAVVPSRMDWEYLDLLSERGIDYL